MEKELTIKINLEKLTQDLLTKEIYAEGYTGSSILENQIKTEIKNNIKNQVVADIEKSLNLEEFRDMCYGKNYLKQTANDIISKELKSLVKEKTENWIKQNMRWIVEKEAEKHIETFLVPRMQKMINNLIIVNTEAVENEMEELKNDYENQIKDVESNF